MEIDSSLLEQISRDHDMVISLNQRMNQVCAKLDGIKDMIESRDSRLESKIDKLDKKMDEKFETWHINCNRRQTDCDKSFLRTSIFKWITGFIIAGILALGGFAADTRVELESAKTEIHYHMQENPSVSSDTISEGFSLNH